MNSTAPITRILALFGAIPFAASAVLPLFGIVDLPYLGSTKAIAAAYGLTIASFMAGVHWGTALNADEAPPVNLYITSNAVAVAAWLAFLLVSMTVTIAILAALFAYLLYIDFRLRRAGMINEDYWKTRIGVTVIVIVCLTITAQTG